MMDPALYDYDHPGWQTDLDHALSIFAVFVFLPAIVLNIFVLHLLFRQVAENAVGRASGLLTINKLGSNVLLLVPVAVTTLYSAVTGRFWAGFAACQVEGFLISVAGFWAAISTPMLGVERYAAVVSHRRFALQTWRTAIGGSVLASVLLAAIPFMLRVPFVMQPNMQICLNKYYDAQPVNIAIASIALTIHCADIVSMAWMYGRMYLVVRQVRREVRTILKENHLCVDKDASSSIKQSALDSDSVSFSLPPPQRLTPTPTGSKVANSIARLSPPVTGSLVETTLQRQAARNKDPERVMFVKALAISTAELAVWAPYIVDVAVTLSGASVATSYITDNVGCAIVVMRCYIDCLVVLWLDPLPRKTLNCMLGAAAYHLDRIKRSLHSCTSLSPLSVA